MQLSRPEATLDPTEAINLFGYFIIQHVELFRSVAVAITQLNMALLTQAALTRIQSFGDFIARIAADNAVAVASRQPNWALLKQTALTTVQSFGHLTAKVTTDCTQYLAITFHQIIQYLRSAAEYEVKAHASKPHGGPSEASLTTSIGWLFSQKASTSIAQHAGMTLDQVPYAARTFEPIIRFAVRLQLSYDTIPMMVINGVWSGCKTGLRSPLEWASHLALILMQIIGGWVKKLVFIILLWLLFGFVTWRLSRRMVGRMVATAHEIYFWLVASLLFVGGLWASCYALLG
ncbi:MAG: hypothetical protein L6R38_008618 [Xanthoria sp. 2 TBL-2021]|nr:MAG: hypothetical protein L6R38_008618 [Xanthoria sp. 2 TBL-2021]